VHAFSLIFNWKIVPYNDGSRGSTSKFVLGVNNSWRHQIHAASSHQMTSVSESAGRLQTALLQLLETELIPTQTGSESSERIRILSNSTPIFSQLREVARTAHDKSRFGKRKVATARLEVDDRSLALQNLKYQKRHLEEEIRMCRDFR
jgi:hypothetical protein